MDNRSWLSGASATPPTVPSTPSAGYPTGGNVGTNTPPTNPGPYWFHQIGEELRNVIAAAGLTPAAGTLNQLLTALQAMFAADAASMAKAWVNFNGTLSGTITPRKGYHITSVVKNGTGDYTITWSGSTDINFVWTVAQSPIAGGSYGYGGTYFLDNFTHEYARTANSLSIKCFHGNSPGEPAYLSIAIFD